MHFSSHFAGLLALPAIVYSIPASTFHIDISVTEDPVPLPEHSAPRAPTLFAQHPVSKSDVSIQGPARLPAAHNFYFDEAPIGKLTDGIELYADTEKRETLLTLTGGQILDLPDVPDRKARFRDSTKVWATTDDSPTLLIDFKPDEYTSLRFTFGRVKYTDGKPKLSILWATFKLESAKDEYTLSDGFSVIYNSNPLSLRTFDGGYATKLNLTFGDWDGLGREGRTGDLPKGDFAFLHKILLTHTY